MDLGTYIEKSGFKILQPARSRRDAPGAVGGTAFWVTPDGYALTCYHVVAVQGMDPNAIDIEYDGAPLRARLVDDYSNSARDIAVLRLNGDRPLKLPCVRLGPAGTLPWAGRAVWLFGY